MTTYHTVMPGQNLSSIARQYNLKSWKDIYKYDANEAFRGKRPNENLIFPGDIVLIPDGSADPKAAAVPTSPPLSCDSKAVAVAILKTSPLLDANTKSMLSPGLIAGIIAAEAARIDGSEALAEWVGVPGTINLPFGKSVKGTGGQGPGQLYVPAYTDVMTNLKPELSQFLVHMGTTCGHGNNLRRESFAGGAGVSASTRPLALHGYPADVIYPVVADFFIAGYLALRIKDAQKPGRSADDQLQYGIGRYSGAFNTLQAAQTALIKANPGASVLEYQPLKIYLESSGDAKMIDVAAYIEEVYDCR
jgi:hypothetical protein